MTAPVQFCDARVFHARLRPHGLRFRYDVTSMVIDLDRLEEANRACPLFSVGGFNLFGFHERDHGAGDGSPLRAHVEGLLRKAGMERPARIALCCFPRILGFVFDPLSIFCCFDESGAASAVVYEVRNTFGERHSYVMRLSPDAQGAVAPHECDKIFYVSPFMDMALRYRFRLTPASADGFALKIIERDHEGVVLTALIEARAFAPSRTALLTRLARTPLLGFKVLAGIHLQAVKLWAKGHPLRARPAPPAPASASAPGAYSQSSASPAIGRRTP